MLLGSYRSAFRDNLANILMIYKHQTSINITIARHLMSCYRVVLLVWWWFGGHLMVVVVMVEVVVVVVWLSFGGDCSQHGVKNIGR